MRTCRTCGQPEEPHNFRHPFVSTDDAYSPDGLKKQQGDSGPSNAGVHSLPIDPVLRIALIDAGVITVDQLDAASKKVQVTQQGVAIGSSELRGRQGWGNQ